MWRRRILYLLALVCALTAQLFDVGYLFHYIFVLTAVLPWAGLLVSLPAMLGLRAWLTGGQVRVLREEDAGWELKLHNRFSLPVARVTGRVRLTNRMTGETNRFRERDRRLSGGEQAWAVDTGHCGLVECRVDRLWVCDCLGLFALPVRAPGAGTLLVCPRPLRPDYVPLPEGTGASRPVPRGKAPTGEEYELRPYRPGDTMRTIHWKMSAKRDDLVTRELLEERRPVPVLTLDHFGPLDRLDRTLDVLAGYSQVLLEQERPHEVRWAEPQSGAVRRYAVSCEREWTVCLTALLSDPAPAQGRSILEQPLAVDQDAVLQHIHITGEEGDHGKH